MTDGSSGTHLIDDPDPQRWAGEFVAIAVEHPQLALDAGAMRIWFASAMLAGERKQLAETGDRLIRIAAKLRRLRILCGSLSAWVAADLIMLILRAAGVIS